MVMVQTALDPVKLTCPGRLRPGNRPEHHLRGEHVLLLLGSGSGYIPHRPEDEPVDDAAETVRLT